MTGHTSAILTRIGQIERRLEALQTEISQAATDAIDAREVAQQLRERMDALKATGTVTLAVKE